MNCQNKYDIIFTDAFNDLSIPYHLTTKEFFGQLKNILTDNGIVMSNIIDNFQKGVFLPSFIKTLQEVFGEKNVYLVSVSPNFNDLHISTFIVIAAKGNIDMMSFDKWLKDKMGKEARSVVVSESMLNSLLSRGNAIVLSDDYAPVDNLIAPVFEERFGYNRRK
jgi:spermidine synthase